MQRRLTTQDVTWFLDVNGLGRLDLEPSYQRRSVWTRADRQYFLDTIFNNYPSPAIFLHKELDESGNATYHVVDGKQRLETVLLFVANSLSIKDDFGDTRLANKRWRDLTDEPEMKRRLWDYQFTVEMLDSIEPAVVNDVFGRLNRNSRKLMPQEIRHSRYDGWFISAAEREAERPLWKHLKVATTARARRMADVQFISELMAVTLSGQTHGFDQEWLNELYAAYEDPDLVEPAFDSEAFVTRFDELANFLQEVEEHDHVVSRYASSFAHIYTLWAWLSAKSELPPVIKLSQSYAAFMSANEEISAGQPMTAIHSQYDPAVKMYADASRGASTDARQRLARDEALSAVLDALLLT